MDRLAAPLFSRLFHDLIATGACSGISFLANDESVP